MSWTDENVELLKKLWSEGASASQIAERLSGDFSRNAVIGKVHRLGLSGRAVTVRKQYNRPPRKPRAKKRKATHFNPFRPLSPDDDSLPRDESRYVEQVVVPVEERVKLADLGDSQCKFPIGDPQDDDFHFCNGERLPGLPYCEGHCAVAYRAETVKRKNTMSPGFRRPWVRNPYNGKRGVLVDV